MYFLYNERAKIDIYFSGSNNVEKAGLKMKYINKIMETNLVVSAFTGFFGMLLILKYVIDVINNPKREGWYVDDYNRWYFQNEEIFLIYHVFLALLGLLFVLWGFVNIKKNKFKATICLLIPLFIYFFKYLGVNGL